MKRLALLLLTGFVLALPISGGVAVVYAQNPLDPACDTLEDPSQSPSCSPDGTDNPLTGADGLLALISNIIAFVAGVAAVIMIMIGGFRYITANGDAQSATNAKKTVFAAAIGLLVIAASWSIITFVLRSL